MKKAVGLQKKECMRPCFHKEPAHTRTHSHTHSLRPLTLTTSVSVCLGLDLDGSFGLTSEFLPEGKHWFPSPIAQSSINEKKKKKGTALMSQSAESGVFSVSGCSACTVRAHANGQRSTVIDVEDGRNQTVFAFFKFANAFIARVCRRRTRRRTTA